MWDKMKRALYWVGLILVIGILAAMSYVRPGPLLWVAWGNAAILWLSAYYQRQRAEMAEASRDRWQELSERQLVDDGREIGVLRGAVSKLTEINQVRNAENKRLQAELARLRPYTEQTHASAALFAAASEVFGLCERRSIEEVEAFDRLEEALSWWDALRRAQEGPLPGEGVSDDPH